MNLFEIFEIPLNEAQNYEDMFAKIFAIIEEYGTEDAKKKYKTDITQTIKDVKKDFKKADRITWYLRIVKFNILKELVRFSFIPDDVRKAVRKEIQKLEQKGNFKSPADVNEYQIYQQLQHFLSLDKVKKIQNYTFTNQPWAQIKSDFEEYEQEWKDSISTNTVEIQNGDKILLSFDGGQKAWWLLPRGACEDEASMMGHCGNVPSEKYGDRILSFRTATDDPDKWVPHLTFIIDSEGYLGEMKGRGNEKPAKRYHPYIIDLIRHDMVEGIKGGGYEPENNFSMNDLDPSIKEKLIEENPKLASLYDLYQSEGMTKRVENRIQETLNDKRLPEIYSIESDTVILTQFDDMESLFRAQFRDISQETFAVHEMIFDDYDYDMSQEEMIDHATDLKINDEIIIRILEKLTDKTLEKIASDLDMPFDYSSYEDRQMMAEVIDNSKYGEILRLGIVKALNIERQNVKDIEGFDKFVDSLLMLLERAITIHQAGLHATGGGEYNLEMHIGDFIEMISEGDDEYYEYDLHPIRNFDEWLVIEDFNFEEDFEHPENVLNKDEVKIFEKFVSLSNGVGADDVSINDINNLDFGTVANIVEKEMQLMDSQDMSRLKMLAGLM